MFQDLVPLDTQVQFSNSRQHINILTNAVCKLRDIAERMVLRATSYAADMLQIGKELRYVMRLTSISHIYFQIPAQLIHWIEWMN